MVGAQDDGAVSPLRRRLSCEPTEPDMPIAFDLIQWTALFCASLLLALSPGPAMAFVLSRTALLP
jgi:hypothetical protein